MELANYIYSIIKSSPIVMFSWGFNSPIAIKNGLRFKVNGFKHQGWVSVVYNEGTDLFEVSLIKNGKVVKEVEDVYVDMLISLIDGLVERSETYKEDVEQWLCEAF